MKPYTIVLARTQDEAAKYVRRAKLPRGRWRIATSAKTVRGLRRAEVHILDGFEERPDRHSVMSELRHAKCEFFSVSMPESLEIPAVDQGDGMGEQLTIQDLLATSEVKVDWKDPAPMTRESVEKALSDFAKSVREPATQEPQIRDETPVEEPEVSKRRRSRCKSCGTLHFTDEACPPSGLFD